VGLASLEPGIDKLVVEFYLYSRYSLLRVIKEGYNSLFFSQSDRRGISISRDEICAIYAQGEEAVMAWVESWVAQTHALEARVEA
jgi:hypothetical protein